MGKLAFLFPGQGSQKVGMGAELDPAALERWLGLAEEASGLPIARLVREGPMEELTRTDVAQPALFAVSMAVHEHARGAGLSADLVAGHSLGEYTAAAACGALPPEDGMRAVAERGRLMAGIQEERPGAMAAIIGLSAEVVQAVCDEAAEKGVVAPANYNSPSQIVVSGEQAAVDRVVELANEAGAKRAIPLKVGAAFHSSLMEPVQTRIRELLESIDIREPEVPLVSNASGVAVGSADGVRDALVAQIASPVRWVDCVEALAAEGCDAFLELGPGRVLGGLVRQILDGAQPTSTESPEALQAFAEARTGD